MPGLFLIDDYLKVALLNSEPIHLSKFWDVLTPSQRTPLFVREALKKTVLENGGGIHESRDFPGCVTLHVSGACTLGAVGGDLLGAGKYEYRFFSPTPVIILNIGELFDLSTFTYKESQDDYLLMDSQTNIKVRKKSFQLKKQMPWEGTFIDRGVTLFSDKEKIRYPLDSGFLNHLFGLHDGSLETTLLIDKKDVLAYATGVLGVPHEVVQKKRYKKNLSGHTKIEIAQIICHDETWQSVCIESLNVIDVLALSLFFDMPPGSFVGNYHDFLTHIRARNAAVEPVVPS